MSHRPLITGNERFHFSRCLILFSLGGNDHFVFCFWDEFEGRISSTFIERTFQLVRNNAYLRNFKRFSTDLVSQQVDLPVDERFFYNCTNVDR